MLSIVKSHVAFVASAEPGLRATGTYDTVVAHHVDQIARSVKALNPSRVDLMDAASAIESVQGSCFTHDQKVALTMAIH